VLSLAWSIAQLGWVAGPAAMLVFAGVTALQSTLFADCYRSPDPEHGPHRNRTYAGAVDRNLGSSSSWVCMLLQHTALFGYGIAYTITASISCRQEAHLGVRLAAVREPVRLRRRLYHHHRH
jgi:amino acid permease